MRAGPAVDLFCQLGRMAETLGTTHLTLIPGRVRRYRLRHTFGQGNPTASIQELFRCTLVVLDAFGVEPIIVLADGHIERPFNVGPVHIQLHLAPVDRLGFVDPFLD